MQHEVIAKTIMRRLAKHSENLPIHSCLLAEPKLMHAKKAKPRIGTWPRDATDTELERGKQTHSEVELG